MSKKETDANSKVEKMRTNSAFLKLEHVQERMNESGMEKAETPESDSQKSDVKTTSK